MKEQLENIIIKDFDAICTAITVGIIAYIHRFLTIKKYIKQGRLTPKTKTQK